MLKDLLLDEELVCPAENLRLTDGLLEDIGPESPASPSSSARLASSSFEIFLSLC